SVLASRLPANPNVTVLVVEAGGDNRAYTDSIAPFSASGLANSGAGWKWTTIPQPGFSNRSVEFERGYVLGGSSSNSEWCSYSLASWLAVEGHYSKSSRMVPPVNGHNNSEQLIPSAHGNGPVEVSVAGKRSRTAVAYLNPLIIRVELT
ncbi:uncharacterized protein BDR25DRAFT_224910, partial [Lindgomyces ingoldianus]